MIGRKAEIAPDGWYEAIAGPGPVRALRHYWLTVPLIAAAGVLLLNLLGPASLTTSERVLASVLIMMTSVPVVLWQSGYDRTLAFMPFFSLIYAVYYGVSPFIALPASPRGIHAFSHALGLSCIGFFCVMAGYYNPLWRRLRSAIPKMNLRWDGSSAVAGFAYIIAIVGLISYYVAARSEVSRAAGQTVAYIGDLALVAMGLLFGLQLAGRLDVIGKLFLWLFLVPVRMALGLVTLAVYQGAAIPLFLLLIYCSVRRRIPWLFLVFCAAGVVVLQPIKTAARLISAKHGVAAQSGKIHADLSLGEMSDMVGSVMGGGMVSYSEIMQIGFQRLDMGRMFALVIRDTPAEVPFWDGESYYPILVKPIPRFLYPGKPLEYFAGEFGHRYGLIAQNDTETSVNVPQVVEAYANFGDLGVVIVMLVIGTIYRGLSEVFVHEEMGIGAVVGVAYILSPMLVIEHQASLAFGGLPFHFLYLGLLHLSYRILSDLGRAPARRAVAA